MNIPSAVRISAAVILAVLVVSCGSPRRGVPLKEPLVTDDESVRRGAVLFDKHCDSCHVGGEGGLGPGINHLPLPRFMLAFQMRHGLGTMPKFSEDHLSDDEVQDIANYLVALRHSGK